MRVHYTALNRMDLLQVAGKYPVPPGASDVLGVECSGIVEESKSSAFAKGDRVMALASGGTYADFCLVNDSTLMKIPDGLSMKEAAAIPETWLTAFQLLHLVGGPLLEKENVLIHAAGSGLGALQPNSCAERALFPLQQLEAMKSSQRPSLLELLLASTTRKGSGQNLSSKRQTARAQTLFSTAWEDRTSNKTLRPWQSMVAGFPTVSWEAMELLSKRAKCSWQKLLRKRASLRATTLRSRPKSYKADLVSRFITHAKPHFESGNYKAVIDQKEFALESASDAHAYMASNLNIGKILLKVL